MKAVFIIFISLSSLSCTENQSSNKQQIFDEKSEIPIKNQDYFPQWQGNYQANFEISRTDGNYQVNYDVKVINKEKVSITEKINDENNSVPDLFIESASSDKLVIKSKSDDTVDYIIALLDGKYYLMGNTVYMLNPPNDRYLLKKEN